MNGFKKFHPVVNFFYFAAVISFTVIFMHPFALAAAFLTGAVYSVMLRGRFRLLYILPLIAATALLNPLFNHEGATILLYLPSGNPLTQEAVFYGIAAGVMLGSVISLFSCFNKIMTSDKLMHLFGKLIPSLSLVFSMILRFVPHFSKKLKAVTAAQKALGYGSSVKSGIRTLSVMLTLSLENAVDTADSMKSRGFGLKKRTSYSNYHFTKHDAAALGYILGLSCYITLGGIFDALYFSYFPFVRYNAASGYTISVFITYFMLFTFPIILEVWEVLRWKKLKSKI